MFKFLSGIFQHANAAVRGAFSNKTAWFYSSDGNALTDCGPNSAAMAASYASGKKYSGKYMNNLRADVMFWNIQMCAQVLRETRIPFIEGPVSNIKDQNVAGIFHVRTNHIVFVVLEGDVAHVYDPLTSPYTNNRLAFLSTVTFPRYVQVTKPA